MNGTIAAILIIPPMLWLALWLNRLSPERRRQQSRIAWYVALWTILVSLAMGAYEVSGPCRPDNPHRRCDLEPPNPVKTGCGLTVQPYQPC